MWSKSAFFAARRAFDIIPLEYSQSVAICYTLAALKRKSRLFTENWIAVFFCSKQVKLCKGVCFIGTCKCDAAAFQCKECFQHARASSINIMMCLFIVYADPLVALLQLHLS